MGSFEFVFEFAGRVPLDAAHLIIIPFFSSQRTSCFPLSSEVCFKLKLVSFLIYCALYATYEVS